MPTNAAVLHLLSQQDGLITCAQAAELGMSERTLRRRVQIDGWQRVAPRVYLAGGHPFTATTRVRTAGLWAGDRAAVSGPAAAFWLHMRDDAPGPVDLTAGRRSGLRKRPGVRVRRRDLASEDLVHSRRLLLTGRALTVLETAIAVPEGSSRLGRRALMLGLLRFTRHDLTHRPEYVLGEIRAALAAAAPIAS